MKQLAKEITAKWRAEYRRLVPAPARNAPDPSAALSAPDPVQVPAPVIRAPDPVQLPAPAFGAPREGIRRWCISPAELLQLGPPKLGMQWSLYISSTGERGFRQTQKGG